MVSLAWILSSASSLVVAVVVLLLTAANVVISDDIHRCYLSRVQPFEFVSMLHDTCRTQSFLGMDIGNNLYPNVEIPLQKEDLECMTSYDEYRSCASCFLCHYHMHHSNDLFAYQYALQSLEASPKSAPALSCLASIYLKKQAYVRAAFYATASHQADPSLQIHYTFLKGSGYTSVYHYLMATHRHILQPHYNHILAALLLFSGEEERLVLDVSAGFMLTDILDELDGSTTLYMAYQQHLHLLPKRMVGPGILAFEEFLNLLENILGLHAAQVSKLPAAAAVAAQMTSAERLQDYVTKEGVSFGSAFFAHHVLKEVSAPLMCSWPQDKTVNLLVQPHHASTTAIFSENIRGMADTLTRLGVPFR